MACVVPNYDSDLQPSRIYMRFCVLAGGSKGNAVYISDGTTAILMDAGLSGVEIQRRLQSLGLHPQDLDAIVVSHEHADHIHGVGVLSRRWNLPVYLNEKTRLAGEPQMGCLHEIREFECGLDFAVNTLRIHPFSLFPRCRGSCRIHRTPGSFETRHCNGPGHCHVHGQDASQGLRRHDSGSQS